MYQQPLSMVRGLICNVSIHLAYMQIKSNCVSQLFGHTSKIRHSTCAEPWSQDLGHRHTHTPKVLRAGVQTSCPYQYTYACTVNTSTKSNTFGRVHISVFVTFKKTFNTLSAKDGYLRLSSSNACLPKTERFPSL